MLCTVPAKIASVWKTLWHGGPLKAHEHAQACEIEPKNAKNNSVKPT